MDGMRVSVGAVVGFQRRMLDMKTADSEHYHFSYPKSILVTVNKEDECKCKPSMTDDQAGLNS